MTALDRAFIKAYASRRPPRAASSESSATLDAVALERAGTKFRVDGAHGLGSTHVGGAPAKVLAGRPRRPSAENMAPAMAMSATIIETPERKQRLIVSVNDSISTADWIWQREPNPVFANQASTAEPVASSASTPWSMPKPPAAKPSGKLLSPEVLSLALQSPTIALPAVPPMRPAAPSAPPPLSVAPAADVEASHSNPPAPNSPYANERPAPLSSFALTPRAEERLLPALEVDHFLWPADCLALHEVAGSAIEAFGERLAVAARAGKRRVALVGAASGAGTTTVALCLARLAQARGSWWGLLDADFAQAALARLLGIVQASGWQAVLAGQNRLADLSIASIDDRLILVPLSLEDVNAEQMLAHHRLPGMCATLAAAVDLLLVDAGVASAQETLSALVKAAKIDAVYLVYDERETSQRELAAQAGRLRAEGIHVAGAIANFAAHGG